MKQFTRSPSFYVVFFIASAAVHYLLISADLYGLAENTAHMHVFMPPSPSETATPPATGPLIFSYYKPFESLFNTPLTGFNAGSALLAATFTVVLLRAIAGLHGSSPGLYVAGVWSIISPGTVLLAARQPHVLLSIIFLLLMYHALLRQKTFLVILFILHLFLTHQLFGWISLLLLATYAGINKKRAIRYH